MQQTNNFNQRRNGNLGGQNCSKRENEYIRRPNIVKTCFTCRRYTVKSHAWENQQHACYYGGTPMRHRKTACFEALVWNLILLNLAAASCYFIPWVEEFAANILSLEDAKCEIASLSNTCGLHMFKQWSNSGAICSAGQ